MTLPPTQMMTSQTTTPMMSTLTILEVVPILGLGPVPPKSLTSERHAFVLQLELARLDSYAAAEKQIFVCVPHVTTRPSTHSVLRSWQPRRRKVSLRARAARPRGTAAP